MQGLKAETLNSSSWRDCMSAGVTEMTFTPRGLSVLGRCFSEDESQILQKDF